MNHPAHRLSKSRFLAGLQCHKQLWWRAHEPDAPELVPEAIKRDLAPIIGRYMPAEAS